VQFLQVECTKKGEKKMQPRPKPLATREKLRRLKSIRAQNKAGKPEGSEHESSTTRVKPPEKEHESPRIMVNPWGMIMRAQ
jgi:hypothetical protein